MNDTDNLTPVDDAKSIGATSPPPVPPVTKKTDEQRRREIAARVPSEAELKSIAVPKEAWLEE